MLNALQTCMVFECVAGYLSRRDLARGVRVNYRGLGVGQDPPANASVAPLASCDQSNHAPLIGHPFRVTD